jgi:hypothetical protein
MVDASAAVPEATVPRTLDGGVEEVVPLQRAVGLWAELWQNQRKVRVVVGTWGGSRHGFLRVLPGFDQN